MISSVFVPWLVFCQCQRFRFAVQTCASSRDRLRYKLDRNRPKRIVKTILFYVSSGWPGPYVYLYVGM